MQALCALVRTYSSALLGYSGGVDSTLLAVVLRQELGKDRMLAAIGRSASYPEAQWRAALELAARFDIPLVEIHTHELEDPNYLANPTNRCFFCKTELWSRLVPLARERGLAVVCDGTNADDLHEHRPGKAAGSAAGVRSPLAEVGCARGALSLQPSDLWVVDHAVTPETGGGGRGVSARPGRHGGLARSPPRRARPRRSRAVLDSLD